MLDRLRWKVNQCDPMIGQCKLCLQDALKLQNSHYFPAGIYKILRDEGQKNPNPWELTNKTVVQTSRQMTAPLLCSDCEQRLSRNGENWVLRHCLGRDGTFPLASILSSITPDEFSGSSTTRFYYTSTIPEIDASAMAYFAASVFWRGSIYPWNKDGSIPVQLGPFQEQFRQYLMGFKTFPTDSALWVVVREGKAISHLTHPPLGGRKNNFYIYNFPMPRLAFTLMVGKNIPELYRQRCIVHGDEGPICVTTVIENQLEKDAITLLQKSLQRKSDHIKRIF